MTQTLDRATELVETGDHPTTAILKAARENNLSAGHARLVGVAYNTGRAAFQREENPDTSQKIAEFDLADPEVIAAEIGHTQKTASVPESTVVSAVYSQPPTFLRQQHKQALAQTEIPDFCAHPCGDLPHARTMDGINAVSSVRSLHRKVAGAREIAGKMLREIDGQLDDMGASLRVLGAPTLATLQKAAEIRKDKGVLAILAELGRRDELLTKAAASRSPVLTEKEQLLYSQAQKIAQETGEFIVANKKLAAFCEAVDAQTCEVLDPFMQKASAANDPFFDLNGPTPKTAGVWQRVVAPFAGAAVGAHGPSEQNENVRHYQMALEDPGHDQTLRGLRARTTLEGLRAADPTLAGYGQDELVNAFNQIAHSAPEAAAHPVYMQAMLRRYLGQGNALDPDDVRSNVLGPQKDLNAARLQQVPELPGTSRRPETANNSRMQTAFQQALGTYKREGL